MHHDDRTGETAAVTLLTRTDDTDKDFTDDNALTSTNNTAAGRECLMGCAFLCCCFALEGPVE